MLLDSRHTSLSDAELMALLADEQDVLPELMSRHEGYVNRYVRRRLADRSQTEDVAQEIWCGVFKGREGFDRSRPFRNWLTGIARRIVAGHYKKQRRIQAMEVNESRMSRAQERNGRETSFDPAARPNSPGSRAEEREFMQKIRANLHHVPRVARKTVEYITLNGLNCSDVAKQLGISQGTVRARYKAAAVTLAHYGMELPALPAGKVKVRPASKVVPAKKVEHKVIARAMAPAAKAESGVGAFGMLERLGELLPRLEKLQDFIGRLDGMLTGVKG